MLISSSQSIVIDDEISLSDATLSDWRKTYSDRMRNERNKAEKTKSDLEETKRGMDLIFGAPEGCTFVCIRVSRRDVLTLWFSGSGDLAKCEFASV